MAGGQGGIALSVSGAGQEDGGDVRPGGMTLSVSGAGPEAGGAMSGRSAPGVEDCRVPGRYDV